MHRRMGVDVRDIKTRREAWAMKRRACLWSLYMHERDVRDDHPTSVGLVNNATNLWKRMWNITNEVEPFLFWIIGKGNMDICLDRWLKEDLPILDARFPVHSLFISNKEVYYESAINMLGYNNSELIKHSLVSLTSADDKLIWTKTNNDNFFY